MVAWLNGRDTLADGLDNACALMSENDGESALGILPRKRVCI
jgi:hypothetical protein